MPNDEYDERGALKGNRPPDPRDTAARRNPASLRIVYPFIELGMYWVNIYDIVMLRGRLLPATTNEAPIEGAEVVVRAVASTGRAHQIVVDRTPEDIARKIQPTFLDLDRRR